MLADAVRQVAAMDPAPGAVLFSGDLDRARARARVRARAGAALPAEDAGARARRQPRRARGHARRFPPAEAGDGQDYRYTTRCGPLRLVAATPPIPAAWRAVRRRALGLDRRAPGRGPRDAHDRGHAPPAAADRHPGLGRARPAGRRSCGPGRDPRRPRARGARSSRATCTARRRHARRLRRLHLPEHLGAAPPRLREPTRIDVVAEPPAFAVHVAIAGELVSTCSPSAMSSARVVRRDPRRKAVTPRGQT